MKITKFIACLGINDLVLVIYQKQSFKAKIYCLKFHVAHPAKILVHNREVCSCSMATADNKGCTETNRNAKLFCGTIIGGRGAEQCIYLMIKRINTSLIFHWWGRKFGGVVDDDALFFSFVRMLYWEYRMLRSTNQREREEIRTLTALQCCEKFYCCLFVFFTVSITLSEHNIITALSLAIIASCFD